MKITIEYDYARGYIEIYGQPASVNAKDKRGAVSLNVCLMSGAILRSDEATDLARAIDAIARIVTG